MKLGNYIYHGCIFTQYRGGSEDEYIPRPITGPTRDYYYASFAYGRKNGYPPYGGTIEGKLGYERGLKEYQLLKLLEGKTNGI